VAAGVPAQQADVDALHARYFASMCGMFEAHKARHPEYAHARLVLEVD
jgi:hypothetical protein